jgi:hypothetical protein
MDGDTIEVVLMGGVGVTGAVTREEEEEEEEEEGEDGVEEEEEYGVVAATEVRFTCEIVGASALL